MASGLAALAQLARMRKNPPTASATGSQDRPAAPASMGSNQTQPKAVGSVGKAVAPGQPAPQNEQTGAPPSFAEQQRQTQAAAAAGYDPNEAGSNVSDITGSMPKAGPLQFGLRRVEDQFSKEAARLAEGGLTPDELQQLTQFTQNLNVAGHESGARRFQSETLQRLQGLAPSGGAGGAGGSGTQNAFASGQVQQQFGPQVEGIYNQNITEADQRLASEQAIRDETGNLYRDVGEQTAASGERLAGLQDQATQMHDQFTGERQNLSQQVMNMPEQVTQKFDQAMTQAMDRVDSAQALIDSKESSALAGVMQGKSAAMQSAVQGIQGNINAQMQQIDGNPNLTAAQKQSMKAQVKMSGLSQIAPAVGSTILQFNDLAARTATSFGQMTTQVQGAGIQAATQIGTAGAEAYANTTVAANQIASGLLNLQQNADSNYVTSMSNLESTRSTIEMAGDSLRAQLLPGMGKPYAQYADAMVADLQMNFNLSQQEFQNMIGRSNLEMYAWIAMQQQSSGAAQMWTSLAQNIGGPVGAIVGFGGMAVNMLGGSSQQAPMPPGLSTQYSGTF